MSRLLFVEGLRGPVGKGFLLSQGDKGEIASWLWLQLNSSFTAFSVLVYFFSTPPSSPPQ